MKHYLVIRLTEDKNYYRYGPDGNDLWGQLFNNLEDAQAFIDRHSVHKFDVLEVDPEPKIIISKNILTLVPKRIG